MKKGRLLIYFGGLVLISMVCGSWGFLVHRTVGQLAIYELPGKLRPFFFKNEEYVVRNAPRPDQRRNVDSTEATKHFIDFEIYGDSAAWKMPRNWEQAVAKYSKDSLLKYGYLPYLIVMVKDSLTTAFRNKSADSILFYATDLGHYIGDAHVPLHTSVNYDGQLTNQKGLHSLWESMIPELGLDNYQLSSKHKARYLDHPEEQIWATLQHSFSLLHDVFAQEKEASKNFVDSTKYRVQMRRGREVKTYSPEFANAYNKLLGSSINDQLIASADLIADFIYTAWLDAGSPKLDVALSKKEKKQCKRELKSFKKNELIRDSMLLVKKIVFTD